MVLVMNEIDNNIISFDHIVACRMMLYANPIIVEVGAFDGNTVISAYRKFSNSTIYAIEPCPRNFKFIKRRFRGLDGIFPRRVLIGNTTGKSDFYIAFNEKYDRRLSSQSNSFFHSFVRKKDNLANPIRVSVKSMTLDDFCRNDNIKHIDLLKINCEGGEYIIFQSKTLDFLSFTNIIDITVHHKHSPFIGKGFVSLRKLISNSLINSGFVLMCGFYDESENSRQNHIRQIWCRRRIAYD